MKTLFFINSLLLLLQVHCCFCYTAAESESTDHDSSNPHWFTFPDDNENILSATTRFNHALKSGKANIERFIHFYLYTRANKQKPQELFVGNPFSVRNSFFTPHAPVKVIVHGFSSSATSEFSKSTKNAYLASDGIERNVIVVQWETLAVAPWYANAAKNTKIVGQKLTRLIEYLNSVHNVTLSQFHIIGHSLGAHVAGFAGQFLNKGQLGRITALDPAFPLFENVTIDEKIDVTDASFVDVIHTASGSLMEGGLGFSEQIGHADFYPNGGDNQPGCMTRACNHMRAYQFFIESIKIPAGFISCKCSTWEEFFSGLCRCREAELMGEYCSISTRSRRSFYLYTNSRPPYGMNSVFK